MKTGVEEYVEDAVHMRLFQQERAIYEVTELIESVMDELGVTRSQLAAKLGQSKGWVTQLLDGEKNKTIRTVADVFAVLGREYRSFQQPIRVGGRAHHAQGEATAELNISDDTADTLRLYRAPQDFTRVTNAAESSSEIAEFSMRAVK